MFLHPFLKKKKDEHTNMFRTCSSTLGGIRKDKSRMLVIFESYMIFFFDIAFWKKGLGTIGSMDPIKFISNASMHGDLN